jgi:hypothetical protein
MQKINIMEKYFNITGLCLPHKHYMGDISAKLSATLRLIEREEYFIINRPRQYGKTTMLYCIENALTKTGNYIVLNISFEGLGESAFQEEKKFVNQFLGLLTKYFRFYSQTIHTYLTQVSVEVNTLSNLSDLITDLCEKTDKNLVLMIDEVDKNSNNELFINFLGMLRKKYLQRHRFKTFHSVVLAGLHDIKTLKAKIRPDSEQKYNSPWNIAADYNVDMNLQIHEIVPMLEEYAKDKNLQINAQHIAERIFYHTSGYPFLVSKLCKMFDESLLPNKSEQTFTQIEVDFLARRLTREGNANFDSLTKHLENNKELYDLVGEVALVNRTLPFNIHNPIVNLGVLYGIFIDRNGLTIHNRIYAEVLLNYMAESLLYKQSSKESNFTTSYKNEIGLNMEALLLGFQSFMKRQYSKHDRDFLERHGRLVFLAFIKPIINGAGHDFKEVQISEEKRLDVVITYLEKKYVAELKVWRGQKAHEEGLLQLNDYLNIEHLKEGYLIIFDHSEVKNWRSQWCQVEEKNIFVIWV